MKISILLPARNEEKVLQRCLDGFSMLNYPKENLQILLGNDNSEDGTLAIMQKYAKDKSCVEVFDFEEKKEEEPLQGKTRILAKLAHFAKGEYLFFTDADIEVPPTWIEGILNESQLIRISNPTKIPKVGVLVGVTGMRTDSMMAAMQAIEWLLVIRTNKYFSDKKWPTTGMGNNMAVLKEAYEAVGGYEKIGFSIVEDYTLYHKIVEKGYDFRQIFTPEVVAFTLPPDHYFEQRKRWIQGAFESKAAPMFAGIFQAITLPVYVGLYFLNPVFFFVYFAINFMLYFFMIVSIEKRLNLKGYLKFLPVFMVYLPVFWFLQLIYFFFKKKVVWKGREY